MSNEHEAEMDVIRELSQDSDGGEEDGDEFETTWIAPTVLHIHAIVETAMVERVNRYLQKHPWVWQALEIGEEDDEEEDDEDDDEEEDDDEDEAASAARAQKALLRSCFVTQDNNARMARYYDELQPVVQASVHQFIERFTHFDIITSFDDYGCIEYRSGSFRREAPEKTSLRAQDEGAIRTLVAIVLLVDTTDDIELPLQLSASGEPLTLRGRAGDIFVWPACPLHPYAINGRDRETAPLRYIQVNIA